MKQRKATNCYLLQQSQHITLFFHSFLSLFQMENSSWSWHEPAKAKKPAGSRFLAKPSGHRRLAPPMPTSTSMRAPLRLAFPTITAQYSPPHGSGITAGSRPIPGRTFPRRCRCTTTGRAVFGLSFPGTFGGGYD